MERLLAIEILSPFNMNEPIHRMKIAELKAQLKDKFNFCEFGLHPSPDGVVINCLHQDIVSNPEFSDALKRRAKQSIVMLMMADFYPNSIQYLNQWSEFVDIFLVPTAEMMEFVQPFTNKKVQVLPDPIDFGLMESQGLRSQRGDGTRVVWFGYPESYNKSMGLFESTLFQLHQSGDIEFHIVSKNASYGEGPNGLMHEYDPSTFLNLLSMFDVCVLSHFPLDFLISTAWKSENKAVLAINRGLPVVASNTPAYSQLLKSYGVGEYIFSTPAELSIAIKKLTNPQARMNYLAQCQEGILEKYSASKMACDWSEIFYQERQLKFRA